MFHSSKIAALILGLVLMSACTKPDSKPDSVNGGNGTEGIATFSISSLEGKGILVNPKSIYRNKTDGANRQGHWRTPRAVSYTFNACIEDRATRNKARGQTFKIEIPGTKLGIADVTPTTPSGCLSWRETIPFSFYVRNSRWVVVERDIVGAGAHTGRQRIRFAINPWSVGDGAREHGRDFVFLREESLPEEKLVQFPQMNAALSGQLQGDDELIADGVQIKTIRNSERSTGTSLRFEITVEPKVRFAGQPDLDSPKWEKINSGDFFVVAHLVMDKAGAGLNERMILGSGESIASSRADARTHEGVVVERVGATGQKEKTEYPVNGYGRVVDGKLVLRMNAFVEARVAQGNLRLSMKLIPRGVSGLKSFEGIYELGHIRSLASSFSGDLIEECRDADTACKVAEFLKTAKNFKEARESGLAQLASPYLFEKVRLRFIQVQPGETATRRTVKYQASTCVVDWFTGEKVIGLPFKVSYEDSTEVKNLETLHDGCLSWTSSIFHEYYEPERFIEKTVIFEKGNGVTAKRSFFINPWDDKFTFGFDEGDFPSELRTSKKIDSRFFLSEYGYHTVKFQYNIDNMMQLEVKKTVLMELQPQVLRYSGIINARKMTEPLRDGIWLMKVAIQKNYLDPAQAGVVIDKLQENQAKIRLDHEPASQEVRRMHKRLQEMKLRAQTKEYISTQTALVRVTDGVIIQPVELTMQDLRMMRVRANFLVQLQPVDEQKLQLDNVARDKVKETVEELAQKREDVNKRLGRAEIGLDEKAVLEKEAKEIEAQRTARLGLIRRFLRDIHSQLNATGSHIDLNAKEYREEDEAYMAPLRRQLRDQLNINDFTKLKLPSCQEVECDNFIEANSFLKERTFVGPVIFLHNAYKDSVRATDNLDEARCGQPIEDEDDIQRQVRLEQEAIFNKNPEEESVLRGEAINNFDKAENGIKVTRQNNLYNYSEYFGSLRHLCSIHVDRLIEREKSARRLYFKSGPAVGSIHNFNKAYNLDLLSLRDEKPKDVEITPEKIIECREDLVSCMRETTERWLPTETALKFINENLSGRSPNPIFSGDDQVQATPWDVEALRKAIFDTAPNAKNAYHLASPRSAAFAGCAILTANILESAKRAGARFATPNLFAQLQKQLMHVCWNGDNVTFDRKLRVFETGRDRDPYIFLGGMNLNLNVGQGFSVSRSQGFNWSAGFELFDMLGPMKGSGALSKETADKAGALVKPLSLKAGYGESFSSSEGTSIADSTYLVAQIAGFKVRLDKFERCAVVRLAPALLQSFREGWGPMPIKTMARENEGKFELDRGVMVCEGKMNDKPREIKESYFYFTQHFTEGDMLDQADLYNHPWLLALRGQRDFAAFLRKIRGQEPITIGNFVSGIWKGKERTLDWPLDHMYRVYRHVTPAFPGFYTELLSGEQGTELPLERSMSKFDTDPNCEVVGGARRLATPGAQICDQRFARPEFGMSPFAR